MNFDEDDQLNYEENIFGIFTASKPDEFWIRQKNKVLFGIYKSQRGSRTWRIWLFLPVLGALAIGFVFIRNPWISINENRTKDRQGNVIPPDEDWAFYENLEVLENWDALVSKEKRP